MYSVPVPQCHVSLESVFAIASSPPFGSQRKSQTVMWSTSTDLGNRHSVACWEGLRKCAVTKTPKLTKDIPSPIFQSHEHFVTN